MAEYSIGAGREARQSHYNFGVSSPHNFSSDSEYSEKPDAAPLHSQDAPAAASEADAGAIDVAVPETDEASAQIGAPRTRAGAGALRAAVIISVAMLLAKIIGLAQAVIVSSLMPLAANDAYRAAFRIIDFVNYLVAGGAMTVTFIPLFSELRLRDAERAEGHTAEYSAPQDAWRFFSTVATVMSLFLTALIFVTHFLAPFIVARYVADFGPEKQQLTVAMLRIMLPAQMAFYLGGMLVGVLNANKRFGASAMTGAIYNLMAVLGALLLWQLTARDPLSFAWGILIGAVVGNFLLPLWASLQGPRRDRLRFFPSLDLNTPGVKRFFRNVVPIMLGVSFPVVDQIVIGNFASQLPNGSLTQLDNANRVLMAPLSILAQAAAVAAFPYLSDDSAARNWQKLSDFMRLGLRRLLFISLPVSFVLILVSRPLIVMLYRHGEYSMYSSHITATAFAYFCVGLFAWAGQQFVARGFYALKDTVTPTVIGTLITFIFYIPLLFLMLRLQTGVAGMAIATTLGAVMHFCSMLIALNIKLAGGIYRAPLHVERVLGTMLRTLCACIVMCVAGLLANWIGARFLATGSILEMMGGATALSKTAKFGVLATIYLARIFFTSAVSLLAFHYAATLFRIPEWEWLRDKIFGRLRRRTAS